MFKGLKIINNKTKINKIIFLQMYKYTKWRPMIVNTIKCNIKYAIKLYSLWIATLAWDTKIKY